MLDHTELDQATLSFGHGGWVCYQTSRLPGVAVYRRYVDREGRLDAVEMYVETIDDSTALTADVLRAIEVGRLDAWVSGSDEDVFRAQMNVPGPDLRRAARHYSSVFGGTRTNPTTGERELNRPHWVADMLFAQLETTGVPQAPMPDVEALEPAQVPEVDARLDVPPARPFGDDFYREVADIYRQLAWRTRGVAGAIADANGVEVTQVHRWVKVARAKGFLPPTTRGKVG